MTLTAPETRTPAVLRWKRIGQCQYEATLHGVRYRLEKNHTAGEWFMHRHDAEAAEHNVKARQDLSLRLKHEWELVKPHSYLWGFGTSITKAKANARLHLIEGRDGDDPDWQD